MKKLLYIGHEYHQKTHSTDFMIQLLQAHYDVREVYLAPSADQDEACLSALAGEVFDVVACLQILPPVRALDRLGCEHLVFFPMYDQSGRWGIEQWFPYRHMRIISFSSTLARRLRRWGFDAHFFQYFPEPVPAAPAGDPHKAFFWNRTEKVNLRTVAALLSGSAVHDLHVHKVLDPGQRFLPLRAEQERQFHVDYSTWFETRAGMQEKIAECGVYFSPRVLEGIGMSFLEAMAMGRCVIAPDRPTMNEYITHGETGFLYDPKRPAPLVLEGLDRIQRQARDSVVAGFKRWQEDRERIIPLLEAPIQAGSWQPGSHLALRCVFHPLQVSRKLRRKLFSIRVRHGQWRVQLCGRTWTGGRPESGR